MAIDATKKFLDYAGLSQFWGIITGKFATKDEAIKTISIGEGTAPQVTKDLIYSTVNGQQTVVTLPSASTESSGLMSADHFKIIDDLKTNIDELAPFAGLKIDGSEVSLTGRRANIQLKYESYGDAASGKSAYISLIDADYPSVGSWSETNESDYLANAQTIPGRYTAVQKGTDIKYYKWSEESAGPVNSIGEPLHNLPISKIDVTELIKTGLLKDADVVVNPAGQAAGTYLKLVFNTSPDADTETTNTVYINVTDLIELYTAGEGISITDMSNEGADDIATTGVIKVNAATDTTLGAIKLGYTEGAKTYKVQLDSNNRAFVAVPWESVTVTSKTTGANKAGQAYLTTETKKVTGTDADGNPTVTYEVNIEAAEGLKKAEELAITGIQEIKGHENYVDVETVDRGGWGQTTTVTLNPSAVASLALADSAVQTIEVSDYLDKNVAYTTKGTKTYTIDLKKSTKDSLALADSAVQTINMMGTELSQTNPTYTASLAKVAMALGSASEVNITEDGTLAVQDSDVTGPTGAVSKKTVATTKAVKTYVDDEINKLDIKSTNAIDAAVKALDSGLTAGTTDAVAHNYGSAQQLYSSITIEDGKLVEDKSAKYTLTIKDISDFAPLSSTDINTICGITA
jgi:hypothetical protein